MKGLVYDAMKFLHAARVTLVGLHPTFINLWRLQKLINMCSTTKNFHDHALYKSRLFSLIHHSKYR